MYIQIYTDVDRLMTNQFRGVYFAIQVNWTKTTFSSLCENCFAFEGMTRQDVNAKRPLILLLLPVHAIHTGRIPQPDVMM